MSMQECYVLQCKPENPSVDPRPKSGRVNNGGLFLYCFLSFQVVLGIAMIGGGIWEADINLIIGGAILFLTFSSLLLWLLFFEPDWNPAAPYTPSEPVFGE